MTRIVLAAVAVAIAAFCLWHPAAHAPQPVGLLTSPAPAGSAFAVRRHRRADSAPAPDGPVVYVAGAVRRPGLYRMRAQDRAADAVRQAGSFAAAADPAGVNLAAHVVDGQEIYVPTVAEHVRPRPPTRGRRAPPSAALAAAGVDVNSADAAELGAVPGIGRAIAERIVELRGREGAYASLDELLDVAGMTPARLERARPFLRQP